ncbi:MAG: GNAT family N-acetyltransferase [Rhodospirillales bacterium]|nr:GNAT family N-acetyltransferase [Rhodospirillales bacterium]
MKLEQPFRAARRDDCRRIAELFNVAGAGVPEYVWTSMADEYPGLTPIEIGQQRYSRDDIPFSYRNTVVAEIDGRVIGILVCFPIEEVDSADEDATDQDVPSDGAGESEEETGPDVMRPYRELEIPGSFYICAVALEPDFRGQGLGTRLMEIARQQAREAGLKTLSLLAFDANPKAVKLYERLGFKTVETMPVVPHPLIRYRGNVLLMIADV